jgi:hypothetical protein
MRKLLTAVAVVVLLLKTADAWAQTDRLFPQYRLDASLPFQFSTNALLTPTNPQSDFYNSPFLKLSLGNINLNPMLSYSIYATAGPDAFARVRTADDAAATVGGQIQETIGNFAVGGIYEHDLIYDGVFRTLLFQSDDLTGFVGYGYSNSTGLTVKPSFAAAYRFADVSSQERFLFTLKAAVTQQLTKEWSVFLTPRLRYYAFTESTSAGRRDIRSGAVGGITYNITADLSTTGSIEYDTRSSNTPGKYFNDTVFLASLDYGHTFDFPK